MTMSYAPAGPVDPAAGNPALAGLVPLSLGRRVQVYAIDAGLGVLLYVLVVAITAATNRNNAAVGSLVTLVLVLGFVALMLWALLGRASRIGGLILKAQYVDAQTGQPAGAKALLKMLLQGALGGVSFGIAPLIMVFATIQPPFNRNWFDRTVGVLLVDRRPGVQGQAPAAVPYQGVAGYPAAPGYAGDPGYQAAGYPGGYPSAQAYPGAYPAEPDAPAPGVTSVAYPGPGWPAPDQGYSDQGLPAPGDGYPPQPAAAEPPFPGQQPLPPQPPQQPAAAQAAPWAAPARPASEQPIAPIVEADGLITSTPLLTRPPEAPTPAVPAFGTRAVPVASPFAPPVVRDMRSVDAAEADKTVLAADSALAAAPQAAPHLLLDDGSVLELDPPTVLGRNPQAPGSHPDAVARRVEDQLASKTHLLVGADDQGPWVIDLHSTNGVKVAKTPGAAGVRIEAGRKVHLPPGSQVTFGSHAITAP